MRQNPFGNRTTPAAVIVPALLVLAPLVFGRWTTEAFTYNKAVLLQLAALALVALTRTGRLRRALREAICEPAALGAMLLGLAAIASSVVSVSPRTSLQGAPESSAGLGVALAYVVVFFAARSAFDSFSGIRTVFRAAVVAAVGAGAYALLQVSGRDPMGWTDTSLFGGFVRPFSTLGHPNILGAYLAMTLPLFVYFAGRARARGLFGQSLVWLGFAGLAAAGVVLSLSRAAWLAAGCGLAVAAFGLPLPQLRRRRTALVCLLTAGGLAAIAVAFGGTGFVFSLAARLRSIAAGEGRYEIWRAAWLVFTDHPWFGSGLDTFQLVFGSRQPVGFWHLEWGQTPVKAHNELLHTLATQGLLGILALVAAVGGVAVAAVRAWRRAEPAERPACVAAIGGLVAFAVEVQFGFTEPACGTLAACLAGVLAGLARSRERTPQTDPPGWPICAGAGLAVLAFAINALSGSESFGASHAIAVLVFGLGIGAVVWLSRVEIAASASALGPERAEASAWSGWLIWGARATLAGAVAAVGVIQPYRAECASRAAELAHDSNPAAELRLCRSAVELAPGSALGWTRLAAAARIAAARETSPASRIRYLKQAREAMEQALALVPVDPAHHANHGRMLAALAASGTKDADAALAEFDTAISLAPSNLLFRADAGQTAIDCRQLSRARLYFEAGLAVDPGFGRFSAGLGAVELAEGRPAEALAWLEKARSMWWYSDNAGYQRLSAQFAAAHLAARHAADAEHWARLAVRNHPEEAVPHWVLAGALELEGHIAEAADEYQTVLGLAPGWVPARDALRRLGKSAR